MVTDLYRFPKIDLFVACKQDHVQLLCLENGKSVGLLKMF